MIADKIKAYRRQHALTQAEFGQLLGVSAQAISKWENGSAIPESDKLIALATYFSVSLDELIGRGELGAQTTPVAESQNRHPFRLVGLLFCLLGVALLTVWGILQIVAPDTSKDIATSSVIMLDGNAILFLFCMIATAVGAFLLLKGRRKK